MFEPRGEHNILQTIAKNSNLDLAENENKE